MQLNNWKKTPAKIFDFNIYSDYYWNVYNFLRKY